MSALRACPFRSPPVAELREKPRCPSKTLSLSKTSRRIWERLRARLFLSSHSMVSQRMRRKMWSTEMNQEFPFPAKLFADAAKSFQDLSGQNLSSAGNFVPPMAQAMMKINIEMMRFAAKRAAECVDVPEKMAKCQSTPEMFKVQMNFLEAMRQQYAEEWFRLLEIANEMSWNSIRPDGAMSSETSPNWSGMTAWMPLAAWTKRETPPATQPSPAAPNSRAAA